MYLVSIIIPVYNAEKYLKRCLDSVVNQTYPNLEIIIIDDGSTDCSGEICDDYERKDSRIHAFHNKNFGVSHARNKGLNVCTGDFIAFIDSDDFVSDDYIESLIKPLQQDNYDLVMCNYSDFYPKGNSKIREKSHFLSQKELNKLTGNFYEDYHIFKQLLWFPCFKIYKKSIVNDNYIRFPEDMTDGEDQVFNFCYYEHVRRYYYVNYPLYVYCHCNELSLSKLKTQNSYDSNIKKIKCEKDFYKKYQVYCYDRLLVSNSILLIRRYSSLNNFDYHSFKLRAKEIKRLINDELEIASNLSLKGKMVGFCLKNSVFLPLYIFCRLDFWLNKNFCVYR